MKRKRIPSKMPKSPHNTQKLSKEELLKANCILNEDKADPDSIALIAELTNKTIKEVKNTQCFELSFDTGMERYKVKKRLKNKIFFTDVKKNGKYIIETWSPLDFVMAYLISDAVLWKTIDKNPFSKKRRAKNIQKNPSQIL